MRIFNIPPIQCDQADTMVIITLHKEDEVGTLEYRGGKRDGELIIFGVGETLDEKELPF